MASIVWATGAVSIPRTDMTLIQSTPIEVYSITVQEIHNLLRDLQATAPGTPWPTTHNHNPPQVISGLTLPRTIDILAPYTIEFENAAYVVTILDGNQNVLDRLVPNNVSVNSNNSTGPLQNEQTELRFGGSVYIDVANGTAGTAFPVGTEDNPSNNLADSLTIAAANNLRRFFVRGSITLTGALDDWTIVGNGEEAEVNLNGQDVADSEFHNLRLTGTMSNGPIRLFDCEIDAVDGFFGTATGCALRAGTIVCAGDSSFFGCMSGVPGTGTPIIDMDSLAIGVEMRAYAGGVQVNNLANAGATLSIDFVSGQAVIDASCTAMQSGRVGGTARWENNSALVFNLDGLVNFDSIWRLKDIPPSGNIT